MVFALAQLKINLRPLWSPAAEALATFAGRFGDLVWSIVFRELQASSTAPESDDTPGWAPLDQNKPDVDDDPWEEERSWRDPSAHKLRVTVGKWMHARNSTDLLHVGVGPLPSQ
jgi:U3 small nucleolar RNA-associated protein 20